jgi:ElaB protein
MMSRTAETGAALSEQLRVLLQQTEQLLQALGDDWDETLTLLRDRAQEAVDTAKIHLGDLQSRAEQTTRRLKTTADVYAYEHPWTTVSIGAAAGLLLGWLVFPRRSARDY